MSSNGAGAGMRRGRWSAARRAVTASAYIFLCFVPATAAAAAVNVFEPSLSRPACEIVGRDAIRICDGLDIREPVKLWEGRWEPVPERFEYRFHLCPTAVFDETACAARSDWQNEPSAMYADQDVLGWAIAAVRAIDSGGTSAPALTPAAQLSVAPQLPAGFSYVLRGGLPDGSVRPGMRIDVAPSDGSGPAAVTGIPTPTQRGSWQTTTDVSRERLRRSSLPEGVAYGERSYDGPFVVPSVDQLSFNFVAVNLGGAVQRNLRIPVRRAPRFSGDFSVQRRQLAPVVGRVLAARVPFRFNAIGFPRPRVTQHWRRCRGRLCVDVPGQHGSSYQPRRRDAGFRLRLDAVAVNPEGRARIALLVTKTVRLGIRRARRAAP